jgi:hypothetical protein
MLAFAATVLMLFLAVGLILDLLLILLVLLATVHLVPSCAGSGAANFHPRLLIMMEHPLQVSYQINVKNQ